MDEPGFDVIAVGHVDQSVSYTLDDRTVTANEERLGAMIQDAARALRTDGLAPALLSIAHCISTLQSGRSSPVRRR